MTKDEVIKLGPGSIIRNKKNLEWTFIVQLNFGDRIVAVRTIELKDLKDWEVIEVLTK